MATVKINKPFTMSLDEVKKGMEEIAEHLKTDQGMKYRWASEEKIEFSHKSGKGSLQIRGQELLLELKIGLLYSAAAPLIKAKVKQFADEYIH